MSGKRYFSPGFFDFLRELKANNNRPWFTENKQRYETEVRDAMLTFIAEFGPQLHKISRQFVADPRPLGGSMFRIYRDVRFSPDKSPYKTNVAASFRYSTAKNWSAPGYYLHLSPGEVFVGAGIYMPDSPTATKIRDAIAAHPQNWTKAISSPAFKQHCELSGNRLARPPRGYDPTHKLIEDLKLKSFIAVADFTEKDACSPNFMDRFAKTCEAAAPLMRFLTTALALKW
jgi:uncharacterized protein (TIGR02453 family)